MQQYTIGQTRCWTNFSSSLCAVSVCLCENFNLPSVCLIHLALQQLSCVKNYAFKTLLFNSFRFKKKLIFSLEKVNLIKQIFFQLKKKISIEYISLYQPLKSRSVTLVFSFGKSGSTKLSSFGSLASRA